MKDNPNSQPNANYSTPQQRVRRKIAREVAAMWNDIARAAGFEPIEWRTACAIAVRINESDQAPDQPRWVTLAVIGKGLSSRSEDPESLKRTARNRVGQLFNQAIPRTGFQILTRYKAGEGEETPHAFVDHLTPVASFFSELLAEEIKTIRSQKLDKDSRIAAEREARDRLIADAMTYLPKCDTELLTPEGEVYARLSAPEAKAYCAKNPEFQIRPYAYTPPAEAETPRRPLTGADFERLKDRAVRQVVDQILDEIAERNSFEEALLFWRSELLPALQKAGASWVKVEGLADRETEKEETKELILSENSMLPPPDSEVGGAENFSAPTPYKPPEGNSLPEPVFKTVENSPGDFENFDSALEAAIFYAKDGWNVLPICQWDGNAGRCTAERHPEDCGGRKPLVAREGGKPGDGYAGSTELAQIRKWWRQFPTAGVGIRLDGHVLIDCDLKDGGPESYEFLRDTFDLSPTLTAITQSGGRHYVFKLPDGLPDAWLKSWTRVGDKVALGGIDLKVDKCGMLFAEPTLGSKGVYRWIDPTVEPAELPRACANFLHAARYKDEEEPKTEKARQASRVYSSSDAPREFDPNQEKYFVDARKGDRHKRLLKIARAIRAAGGNAGQIESALNYHASRFSEPLDDQPWISRVARECELRFSPEVAQ